MKSTKLFDRRDVLKAALAGSAATVLAPARAAVRLPATTSDVIVVGAGLSGLNAALLLESEGLKVTVLEGRQRIGGRLHTLVDVPGKPEAGGNGIGHSYARFLDLARRLGIPMVPERRRTEPRGDTLLHIGGEFIPLSGWVKHPRNPHPEALRAYTPWEIVFGFLSERLPALGPGEWRAPEYAHLDVPIATYLAAHGLNDDSIRLADKFSSYGTNFWQSSLLQLAHVFSFGRLSAEIADGRAAMSVQGGNQRMPEAMARAIRGDVITSKQVEGVDLHPDAVDVHCTDGSRHRARFLVMSLPFSALRLVRVTPTWSGAQAEAVATLPYHAAFQVHFAIEKPFWELDGLPPSFWSDVPVERFNALNYGPEGAISSFMHYSNGDSAGRFDRMSPDAAVELLLHELARIRPATRGALRAIRVLSWQQTPFSGGAYASWMPGQIPRLAGAMSMPHGRLHLCGEHTAIISRGMEGALESGERVALEILNRA